MKYYRQIVNEIKELPEGNSEALQSLLWKLICYSPKIPSRLHQERLIETAERITLKVYDQYFTGTDLNFSCFKWGNGPVKVLLTHGWGSKAGDFSELIQVLKENEQLEIWAFDAPGNGSSEGGLSNLFLYAEAVRQVKNAFGLPQVMIGHSLGGMANIFTIGQAREYPQLLISIAPLIHLKENFIASMDAVNVSKPSQQIFFERFEKLFEQNAADFVVNRLYQSAIEMNHLLVYEENDLISPAGYIHQFLKDHPEVEVSKYEDTSHSKILTDPRVMAEIRSRIERMVL